MCNVDLVVTLINWNCFADEECVSVRDYEQNLKAKPVQIISRLHKKCWNDWLLLSKIVYEYFFLVNFQFKKSQVSQENTKN